MNSSTSDAFNALSCDYYLQVIDCIMKAACSRLIISLSFFFMCIAAHAQEYLFPLNRDLNLRIGAALNADTTGFHTSLQPYALPDLDSVMDTRKATDVVLSNTHFYSTWVGRKLRKEHLLQVDKDDLLLSIDPIFNLQAGTDRLNDRNVFVNTRGLLVQGNVSGRFFFYTSFRENQARYLSYIDSTIRITGVAPGQGKAKFLSNEKLDFSMSTGGMAFRLNRHFDFLFAQDKLFIGDGYRSMLLSDNAYPFPFLRTNMTFWKFRYSVTYAVMQDLQTPPDQNIGYPKKYSTFHHLDVNIGRKNRLSLGFFESVVWAPAASRGYELHYLNPFLFLRPVENSMGSPDNALLGLNVRWKVSKSSSIYGQLMLDEFLLDEVRAGNGWWGNKQAAQLGVKSFSLFGIKDLNFQSEINFARPFTYQHRSGSQNYSHYNQALAHPLGADFVESITFVNYRWRNFFAELKVQVAQMGRDTSAANLGNNIFLSYDTRPQDYGYDMFTGRECKLNTIGIRVNYLVNPKTDFVVEAGYEQRSFSSKVDNQQSGLVYFGLRTSLENYYFDF
ncbi:MAG: hypothetical protein ACKO1U_07465 [Bacteroidota bacterium]